MVASPITNQPAQLLETIPTSVITAHYAKECDIDVSSYFKNIKEVCIYECQQTGYRFYYPFNIAGDGAFYEQLQKYPWYYFKWKWDYSSSAPFIANSSKVLDIGCGYGHFLKYLKEEKNCDCTGLEFNDKAIETCLQNGLTVHKEFIQEHAENNAETYDVVCFFQVLEHIQDIDSFMTAAVKVLKKGGKLIICVPNNNPWFYRFDKLHTLNMPPHHMGMWGRNSLNRLSDIYSLKVLNITEQKLNRFRFYTKLFIEEKTGKNKIKKIFYTAISPLLFAYFILARNSISTGNILAVYEKQ